MLTLLACASACLSPQPGPMKAAFREAVIAVIDSASKWTPGIVGRSRAVVIDRASFQLQAGQAGALTENWSGFAQSIRADASEQSLNDTRICTTARRCTLPANMFVVSATGVRMVGGQVILGIRVSWAYRQAMGVAVYDVALRNGHVVSVTLAMVT